MLDSYGRRINYLRLSLTERCNLRCLYCRPLTPAQKLRHQELLTYEELLRLCGVAAGLGVDRFKVTGGEPLVRRGCLDFLARLKALPQAAQVTLTTNGTLLAAAAQELKNIGLDGVNVSLDTCDAARYCHLTGAALLPQVLAGIDAALAAGLYVKLNCVPLADMTDADLANLWRLAAGNNLPLRFIELMPLGCNGSLRGLRGAQVWQRLERLGIRMRLRQAERGALGNGPAVYYEAADNAAGRGLIGFIEPVHGKFCGRCNRMRLTSAGMLKGCLYYQAGTDMRALLRGGASDGELAAALRQAVYAKPLEHGFEKEAADFGMNEIGG